MLMKIIFLFMISNLGFILCKPQQQPAPQFQQEQPPQDGPPQDMQVQQNLNQNLPPQPEIAEVEPVAPHQQHEPGAPRPPQHGQSHHQHQNKQAKKMKQQGHKSNPEAPPTKQNEETLMLTAAPDRKPERADGKYMYCVFGTPLCNWYCRRNNFSKGECEWKWLKCTCLN